jgi:integrase
MILLRPADFAAGFSVSGAYWAEIQAASARESASTIWSTPKNGNSAAPVHMSELLAKHLRDWLDKHYKPNLDGYLFTNSKGKPYLSDNVVKYGIHRAMTKLRIETASATA